MAWSRLAMSPRLTPCKRDEFIRRLRLLGFTDAEPGTKHAFMLYGQKRQTLPRYDEYSVDLVQKLLRQVAEVMGREITRREWEQLGKKHRQGPTSS